MLFSLRMCMGIWKHVIFVTHVCCFWLHALGKWHASTYYISPNPFDIEVFGMQASKTTSEPNLWVSVTMSLPNVLVAKGKGTSLSHHLIGKYRVFKHKIRCIWFSAPTFLYLYSVLVNDDVRLRSMRVRNINEVRGVHRREQQTRYLPAMDRYTMEIPAPSAPTSSDHNFRSISIISWCRLASHVKHFITRSAWPLWGWETLCMPSNCRCWSCETGNHIHGSLLGWYLTCGDV